jgi:NADH:ubiquinone oxidoreductase subunit 6 (subunit J)
MVLFGVLMLIMLIEVAFSVAIFRFSHPVHGSAALALFFTVNSALLFFLAEPLLATLQLLILVGGVSTYLLLGIASTSSYSFRHSNSILLAAGIILIFGVLAYSMLAPSGGGFSYATQQPPNSIPLASQLSDGMPIIYASVLLMFAAALGAIMVFKRRY